MGIKSASNEHQISIEWTSNRHRMDIEWAWLTQVDDNGRMRRVAKARGLERGACQLDGRVGLVAGPLGTDQSIGNGEGQIKKVAFGMTNHLGVWRRGPHLHINTKYNLV